jgi:thiamine-phosphate pyrophosphorylase
MNKSLALAHFQTSFQFITHQNERFSYLEGAYLALIGGCDWVQLRMKGATDEEVEPIARKLKLACEGAGATFILDDRVELVAVMPRFCLWIRLISISLAISMPSQRPTT